MRSASPPPKEWNREDLMKPLRISEKKRGERNPSNSNLLRATKTYKKVLNHWLNVEKRNSLSAVWQPCPVSIGFRIRTEPCRVIRITRLRFQSCRRALRSPSPAQAALGPPLQILGPRAPEAQNSSTWTLGQEVAILTVGSS